MEEIKKEIKKCNEKIDLLSKKFEEFQKIKVKETPTKQTVSKNISFEEAFEQCLKAVKEEEPYPCMYLSKTGKSKDKCCGTDAVMVSNEDDEQLKIKGEVEKLFFHSLRCNACKKKGQANSESKKKCLEKINGVNPTKASEVNKETLSFLSGNAGPVSPSSAIPKKTLKTSMEIKHEKVFHTIAPYKGKSFVFEREMTKTGKPHLKKTPILKGYVDSEEIDEDEYENEIITDIDENLLTELKEFEKFNFEGTVVKTKNKPPVIPIVKEDDKNSDDDDDDDDKNEGIDEILDGF